MGESVRIGQELAASTEGPLGASVCSNHTYQNLVYTTYSFCFCAVGGFNSESEQQTSDESQDAMKLFAASPPDPNSPYFR